MMEYGFYGRLKKEFPSQIIVDICDVCNYECIHCPQVLLKKAGKISGEFLSLELNKKMVDEVATEGKGFVQQIRYAAAGEPFLHPYVMEMLEYAVVNANCLVSITTNGSLLDEEKIEKLLKLNLGLIDFSIDAFSEETYAKVRKKGVLSVVKNNINTMLRLKEKLSSKTKIVVSFVKQESNKFEEEIFKKYWYEQGVDRVIIRKMHTAGGALTSNTDVINDTAIYPCVYPWERIVLNQKGELGFCPADWDLQGARIVCNDYSISKIKNVWNSEIYNNLREQHLTGNFKDSCVCKNCPDRCQSIWPGNGEIAYGDMIADFTKGV